MNILIGVTFGSVLYFCSLPMRSFAVDRTIPQLREDTRELYGLLRPNRAKGQIEIPDRWYQTKQDEIIASLYQIRDEAQVRKLLQGEG